MAQFTNQARLSYNNSVVNSNIAVGEILEVLSADKTAIGTGYSLGDEITYVISLVNSGTTAITGITVTDDLGAYPFGEGATLFPLVYVDGSIYLFINGVLQPTPAVASTSPLTVSGITLPAGGDLVLVYKARVTEFAPLDAGATVINTASIDGAGIGTPITVSETVTATDSAQLAIIKSIEPVPVAQNGRVNYTFVIQNYGNTPADASANASISDLFDPLLSDLAVAFNGVAWSEPENYTYNDATGLFVTVPGQITVPAATYLQDPTTGEWSVTPGVSTLTVSGTL